MKFLLAVILLAAPAVSAADRRLQCLTETDSNTAGVMAKYVFNVTLAGSGTGMRVRDSNYSYETTAGVVRLDGQLDCTRGDTGYPLCKSRENDAYVHSFAFHQFGIFASGGALIDGGLVAYVGMDCVDLD